MEFVSLNDIKVLYFASRMSMQGAGAQVLSRSGGLGMCRAPTDRRVSFSRKTAPTKLQFIVNNVGHASLKRISVVRAAIAQSELAANALGSLVVAGAVLRYIPQSKWII